jgi:hypothetical protein
VALTDAGRAYEGAIAEVTGLFKLALAGRVEPEQLRAADAVLRAAIDDEALGAWAETIPGPEAPPPGVPAT